MKPREISEKWLTCHELEGLGFERLIGISFRNGTHFDERRRARAIEVETSAMEAWSGGDGGMEELRRKDVRR